MAACQPSNQPPQRTRRSRAHSFRISQISIAQCAAFSASHPPRVLSLAAFGRRPLVYVAPMSLAGIRNPQQKQKSASLGFFAALARNRTESETTTSNAGFPLSVRQSELSEIFCHTVQGGGGKDHCLFVF